MVMQGQHAIKSTGYLIYTILTNEQMIEQIATDEVLDRAYDWLCKRRKKLSPNNEIWDFRKNWKANKLKLQEALRSGEYQFSPQTELRLPDGNIEYWSARDSLVLKAMAIVLGKHLTTVVPQIVIIFQVMVEVSKRLKMYCSISQ